MEDRKKPSPKAEPLELDLRGRVRNIRLADSNGLMAVFEAVANAIQATDEVKDKRPGRIDIQILRMSTLPDAKQPGKVTGFRIEDHGVGFNNENYAAFRKSDTTRKSQLGGRGVGRFYWLRVFDSVQVDSEYDAPDSQRSQRSFVFDLNGVTPLDGKSVGHRGTVITLSKPHETYAQSLQHRPEHLAELLVQHCLLSLLDDTCPPIYITDEGEDTIVLKTYFTERFLSKRQTSEFEIHGIKFLQVHLLTRARQNSVHLVHLCAAKRSVKHKRLTDEVPELTGPLKHDDEDTPVVYAGYVTSDLLDQRV